MIVVVSKIGHYHKRKRAPGNCQGLMAKSQSMIRGGWHKKEIKLRDHHGVLENGGKYRPSQ